MFYKNRKKYIFFLTCYDIFVWNYIFISIQSHTELNPENMTSHETIF